MKRLLGAACAALLLVLLSACGGSYYKVTDPGSGKVFYTTDIDKGDTGAISFEDAKSKQQVTLQNSEIAEISSDEYDKATSEQ